MFGLLALMISGFPAALYSAAALGELLNRSPSAVLHVHLVNYLLEWAAAVVAGSVQWALVLTLVNWVARAATEKVRSRSGAPL